MCVYYQTQSRLLDAWVKNEDLRKTVRELREDIGKDPESIRAEKIELLCKLETQREEHEAAMRQVWPMYALHFVFHL